MAWSATASIFRRSRGISCSIPRSPEDLALAERVLGGSLIGPETFADRLAASGKSLAVVHAGSAGSAYAINPRVAANGHWTFSVLGEAFTRTPQAVRDVVERFGPLPARELPRFEETEYVTRVFIEHVLADLEPGCRADLVQRARHVVSLQVPRLGRDARRDGGGRRELRPHPGGAARAAPMPTDVAILVASDHGQISSRGAFKIADAGSRAAGHPAAMARQLGRWRESRRHRRQHGRDPDARRRPRPARRHRALADGSPRDRHGVHALGRSGARRARRAPSR